MEFERVRLERDGAVAILSMNHPDVLNAVSTEMLKDLTAALDALAAADAPPRCLVLTGVGRAFSTGANLQGRGGESLPQRGAGQALETLFHPFLRRLRDLPYPIITAVNGPAAGAGMSIALMGDLVLCARSAYFLQAFRRIGLVPDCGSTWLLPRLIGRARAIELSLLGERLPAETALAWGLVNRVYDDAALMNEARRLAHELAAGPTVALGMIRRLYWESPQNSYEQQLDLECRTQRSVGATADFREGVKAFLEKRPAKFVGA
jgi:2-(1,2-epoxy-1,2-dihydrophenyl)acetyl-CoA isomerase